MILKVWKDVEAHKDDAEDQLYLKLMDGATEGDEGCIVLRAVKKDGEAIPKGNILIVSSKHNFIGTLEDINPLIPLKTDLRDEVLVYKNREIRQISKDQLEYKMSKMFSMAIRQHEEECDGDEEEKIACH